MSEAGLLLTAVVGLWIAYLVPHRLRYRQQLLESRTDDRFSEGLRVVRVGGRRDPTGQHTAARPTRVLLHPRRGGGSVDRPHALTDRVVADAARQAAAARARQAAHRTRRAAAARRRRVLAVGLVTLSLAGWAAVLAGVLVATVAAVPTVLLAAVLMLGRRAVVRGRASDARPVTVVAPVVGRAVRPSDAGTEVLARVPHVAADAASTVAPSVAPEEAESVEAGATWEPVPVPVPTYTLKPSVRRPEPAPLPAVAAEGTEAAGRVAEEPADGPVQPAAAPTPPAATGGIDLDAVLARRRASGE